MSDACAWSRIGVKSAPKPLYRELAGIRKPSLDAPMPRAPRDLLLVVAVLVLAALLVVLVYSSSLPPALSSDRASWRLTPGVVNPDVTQATIGSTICVSGWTSTIRPGSERRPRRKRLSRCWQRNSNPVRGLRSPTATPLRRSGY